MNGGELRNVSCFEMGGEQGLPQSDELLHMPLLRARVDVVEAGDGSISYLFEP
jgi:hypothetical protein